MTMLDTLLDELANEIGKRVQAKVLDGLADEVVERVIERLSDQNSTWLNNIQYKVKAENVDGLEQFFCEALDQHERQIRDWANEESADVAARAVEEAESAVEKALNAFEVNADHVDGLEDAVKQIVENATFNASISVDF